jgi:glycosyltransferase involved in cell wall biosynthesis
MRIVTVLTSLGVGGAEKQALAVAERMAQRGHEVALVALMPRLAAEWPATLPVVHLDIGKDPVSVTAGYLRARRFLRTFRPHVVHSHSFHANLLARLLRIGLPRFAVISTVHNVYEGGWLRMTAYRLTDRLSERTIAVSKAAAKRFVGLKAVPRRKCLVRANGIDTAEFAPDAARRAIVRTAMGAGAHFVWLSAGRITPAKDYPNLLRAFELVREEVADVGLWIAGARMDAKVHVFADDATPAQAAEGGCQEQVRWLGLRRDMPALLDAADGFVLGSAWEGMPLVVGEAMAMEKLVVATDVGGVRELAGDGGGIVSAKDPQKLAGAMLAAMRRSREERAIAGRAARERIVRDFSIEAAADWWEALYKQLTVNSGQ